MAVGGGGAVALGEGGAEGLGVLIAEVVPGKLIDPQAVSGEEPGHGLQGSFLGPAGPWGQAGEVDGDGVSGGVAVGGGRRSSGMAGGGIGHGQGLVRSFILISSLASPDLAQSERRWGP